MTRIILIMLAIVILGGCASRGPVIGASESLYSTDKSTTVLLKDIASVLEKNRYQVRRIDEGAGILVIKPRRFSVASGSEKMAARQNMQLRQEGASVKIRFLYDCNYVGDKVTFEPCRKDEELEQKIARVETLLLKKITPLLMKFSNPVEDSQPQ